MATTINEQTIPAFLAALIGEGVTPQQIEFAVARVRDMRPGRAVSSLANTDPGDRHDDPLVRSFIYEWAKRLERAA